MAIPESPIPPALMGDVVRELTQATGATRDLVAATLASALISKASVPVSLQDALDLQLDLSRAMYRPANQSGSYSEWQKTRAERLARTY